MLYLSGILLAIISVLLLIKFFFKGEEIPFVMELPPYRMPTLRSILNHVGFRTGLYLKKIGGVILIHAFYTDLFPLQRSHCCNKARIGRLEMGCLYGCLYNYGGIAALLHSISDREFIFWG